MNRYHVMQGDKILSRHREIAAAGRAFVRTSKTLKPPARDWPQLWVRDFGMDDEPDVTTVALEAAETATKARRFWISPWQLTRGMTRDPAHRFLPRGEEERWFAVNGQAFRVDLHERGGGWKWAIYTPEGNVGSRCVDQQHGFGDSRKEEARTKAAQAARRFSERKKTP